MYRKTKTHIYSEVLLKIYLKAAPPPPQIINRLHVVTRREKKDMNLSCGALHINSELHIDDMVAELVPLVGDHQQFVGIEVIVEQHTQASHPQFLSSKTRSITNRCIHWLTDQSSSISQHSQYCPQHDPFRLHSTILLWLYLVHFSSNLTPAVGTG